MVRRGSVWSLALPLAAVGWLAAHSLAYLVVAPDPHHRGHLLSESGHGYLPSVPVLAACAVAVVVVGFAAAVHAGLHGRAGRRLPIWPVAAMPPVGFAVQEHVERLIEHNSLPLATVTDPVFLVGMALQLPFAIGAVVLAREIHALGHSLGRRLVVRWTVPRPVRALPLLLSCAVECDLVRRPVLAMGHGERAPPFSRHA